MHGCHGKQFIHRISILLTNPQTKLNKLKKKKNNILITELVANYLRLGLKCIIEFLHANRKNKFKIM